VDEQLGGGTAWIIGLREAFVGLRDARTLDQLTRKTVTYACRGCGFDRALLMAVHGSEIVIESAHCVQDEAWAPGLIRRAGKDVLILDAGSIEAEVVRRGIPVLIADADNDRSLISRLLGHERRAGSVTVPIMPEGSVVAILYADRAHSGPPVGAIDRDLLSTFAEGVGYALERTVLRERQGLQQGNVSTLMNAAGQMLNQLTAARIDLVSPGEELTPAALSAERLGDADLLPHAHLTPREKEVLSLLAAGESNTTIASRLVISEGTVKSHVKHILRKLGAKNRAEAVSRYLGSQTPALHAWAHDPSGGYPALRRLRRK
jgi:DNA-binding CsgD family transcriptional regulator